MSVSAIAGELVTEQDSADDEIFKPGHKSTVAKYYKTDGSIDKAMFQENDKIWNPTTDNEQIESYDDSVGSIKKKMIAIDKKTQYQPKTDRYFTKNHKNTNESDENI